MATPTHPPHSGFFWQIGASSETTAINQQSAFNRPVYPNFQSLECRFQTFKTNTGIHPGFAKLTERSIMSLAASGFFLKQEEAPAQAEDEYDLATCFYCGKDMYAWKEGDNPLIEHKKFVRDCESETLLDTRKIEPIQCKSPDTDQIPPVQLERATTFNAFLSYRERSNSSDSDDAPTNPAYY